ncbi:hypothetical protein BC941DRAFT_252463 [Chlamydoabsidia padenii]|nr:hypothetical protein BC941DRAFT_252463 [Chlamydoabsidia padenii]
MDQCDSFNIISYDFSNANSDKDNRKRGIRACDLCRKKKVKCVYKQEDSCMNCIAYNETCLVTTNLKKRRLAER